jgi:hypothetical protein
VNQPDLYEGSLGRHATTHQVVAGVVVSLYGVKVFTHVVAAKANLPIAVLLSSAAPPSMLTSHATLEKPPVAETTPQMQTRFHRPLLFHTHACEPSVL